MGTSLVYWQDKLAKTQPRRLKFVYKINGAKDISEVIPGTPVLAAFDALTQADIDAHLGTSSEFTAAQFDATAMGLDALGLIIDMQGQASKVVMASARLVGADEVEDAEERMLAEGLTDSTLESEAALGANGNIALRTVLTGLDAATAGHVEVEIFWISK